MTAIDEIKTRIDIVDLVSETVKLRKAGKNYTGFCPFHPNSRTPAFVVFPDSGTWRCFGQCNEGGDIFQYVMKKEGWDFAETLKYLAERAGVKLEAPSPERQEKEEAYDHLRALLEDAVTFYRHHLLQTPAGQPARAYLEKRGLTAATIETFGLGYAPNSYQAALDYFSSKGYSPKDLLDAGLATERQEGNGVYDRFRNRIMFPIRDMAGRMAGFGARILNPDDVPKFLNSPQTPIFDKGRLLYGLDQARKAIRAEDQAVIVEGYLDVIVLHQGGFQNVVSPMGTALTEDQLHLLKKFSRRIVLALDADAAGQKATLRGLEVARQALDQQGEIFFDARGLLRNEARLQADLRVTTIPEGMDPDEVVLRNPDEWKKIVEQAQPVVVHVMDTLAKDRDIDDPKVKSEVAAQVMPLIEDVPNPVERDSYRQRLARLLKVDERAILGAPARTAPRMRRPKPEQAVLKPQIETAATPDKRAQSMELHAVRLLLRSPENLYKIDRVLQQAGVTRLAAQDFENASLRSLARIVQQSLEQDAVEPSEFISTHVPEALTELYQTLMAPLERGEPPADKLMEDLVRTLMELRLLRINEGLKQLRFLQEEIQQQEGPQSGGARLNPYLEMTMQYTQARFSLERALSTPFQLD